MPRLTAASIWPARHGREAGAENFGEIGAAIDAEAEHARRRRRQAQADGRAAVIEQIELHQERRAAHDLDEARSSQRSGGTGRRRSSATTKPSTSPSSATRTPAQQVTPKPLSSSGP